MYFHVTTRRARCSCQSEIHDSIRGTGNTTNCRSLKRERDGRQRTYIRLARPSTMIVSSHVVLPAVLLLLFWSSRGAAQRAPPNEMDGGHFFFYVVQGSASMTERRTHTKRVHTYYIHTQTYIHAYFFLAVSIRGEGLFVAVTATASVCSRKCRCSAQLCVGRAILVQKTRTDGDLLQHISPS